MTGRSFQGAGADSAGGSKALTTRSTTPRTARVLVSTPARSKRICLTTGQVRSMYGPIRAGPERVDVRAAAHLGEVDMPPARLDPADQRPVGRYVLARPDRGRDVPVAELDASAGQDANDVRVERVRRDDARYGRVDRRAVRRGDVHSESGTYRWIVPSGSGPTRGSPK